MHKLWVPATRTYSYICVVLVLCTTKSVGPQIQTRVCVWSFSWVSGVLNSVPLCWKRVFWHSSAKCFHYKEFQDSVPKDLSCAIYAMYCIPLVLFCFPCTELNPALPYWWKLFPPILKKQTAVLCACHPYNEGIILQLPYFFITDSLRVVY